MSTRLVPIIEPRDYAALRDAAIARIPVHNPEWTNHTASDPGITLLELFAFLMESVAYRANQIPERNRRAFLSLLGVPRLPATSARGIVQIRNGGGPPEAVTIGPDVEVRAGEVPFRTERGLDVLPVDARAFVKQRGEVTDAEQEQTALAYLALTEEDPAMKLDYYRAVPADDPAGGGIDVGTTPDRSIWIALLVRMEDSTARPDDDAAWELLRQRARGAIAGRVLNIGVVPVLDADDRRLAPGGRTTGAARLDVKLPQGTSLGKPPDRGPRYAPLQVRSLVDVSAEPGVLEVELPAAPAALSTWTDVEAIEDGVGDMPPSLVDSPLQSRLVTWLRLQVPEGSGLSVLWTGINAMTVEQRTRTLAEALPAGTGQPDQEARLARAPVLPDSVQLTVGEGAASAVWARVDDLTTAGAEVPIPAARLAPGVRPRPEPPSRVFALDPATGAIRFGTGIHGARPAADAPIRVTYDQSSGAGGNVGPGTLTDSPELVGLEVANPVRTWGGADGESLEDAERQAARYLRNRDRAVTPDDYEALAWRTPGVQMGRIEVLPAWTPSLAPAAPGIAPGAITLLVIPRPDPLATAAPAPDASFLEAVCRWIEPRRLVTTEVVVRGPAYVGVRIAVGLEIVPGESEAVVVGRLKDALRRFLAPVDPTAPPFFLDDPPPIDDVWIHRQRGWPLEKPVVALELAAACNRVEGVRYVRSLRLFDKDGHERTDLPLVGLELPAVAGIVAVAGDAPGLEAFDAGTAPAAGPQGRSVPVPVVPEVC